MVVDGKDHAERNDGDEDFAKYADKDGTPALIDEVAQFRAEAYAGEGGKERPL